MRYTLAKHPVIRDFMYLTKYTTPYGTEHETFRRLLNDRGFRESKTGNFFGIKKGELGTSESEPLTLFVAHMDTADHIRSRVRREVNSTIIGTDGQTLLGADDKAGCSVLLHLWRNNVPGVYMFAVGEEVGCVGSQTVASELRAYEYWRAISWDRYGYSSVITHQMGERTASNEFASALISEYKDAGLTFKADDGGSFTDTYSFIDTIPECTNISVGYFNQHSPGETQDAEFLVDVAEASTLIDWENLPTVCDPNAPRESLWMTSHNYHKVPWIGTDDDNDEHVLSDIEILQAVQYGVLTYREIETFVRKNPDDAASLLYEKLMGY